MQPQTSTAPPSTYQQAPPSTNFPPPQQQQQQYSAPQQQQYGSHAPTHAPPPQQQQQNFPTGPNQFPPQRRFDDMDRKSDRFPEGPRGRGRDDRRNT